MWKTVFSKMVEAQAVDPVESKNRQHQTRQPQPQQPQQQPQQQQQRQQQRVAGDADEDEDEEVNAEEGVRRPPPTIWDCLRSLPAFKRLSWKMCSVVSCSEWFSFGP